MLRLAGEKSRSKAAVQKGLSGKIVGINTNKSRGKKQKSGTRKMLWKKSKKWGEKCQMVWQSPKGQQNLRDTHKKKKIEPTIKSRTGQDLGLDKG